MAKRFDRWAVEGFSSPGRWVASHAGLPTGRAKAILRKRSRWNTWHAPRWRLVAVVG